MLIENCALNEQTYLGFILTPLYGYGQVMSKTVPTGSMGKAPANGLGMESPKAVVLNAHKILMFC